MKFNGKNILVSSTVTKFIKKNCKEVDPDNIPVGYTLEECKECKGYFLRFYASKSVNCCSCREINRRLKSSFGVFEIKDGYPRSTKIQTREELDQYYAGDEIQCLLCGNGFSMLGQHLTHAHEISAREYKIRFGLPLSVGLLGTEVKEKLVNIGYEQIEKQGVENCIENLKTKNKSKKTDITHSIVFTKERKENSKTIGKYPRNKKEYKGNPPCSKCKKPINRVLTEHAITVKGCALLCGECKRISHSASQQKWADKKGINLKEYKREISRRHYEKTKAALQKKTNQKTTNKKSILP